MISALIERVELVLSCLSGRLERWSVASHAAMAYNIEKGETRLCWSTYHIQVQTSFREELPQFILRVERRVKSHFKAINCIATALSSECSGR